jgi:hypothetical protein
VPKARARVVDGNEDPAQPQLAAQLINKATGACCFRENGASDKRGEELVKKAWKANRHVPAVLADTKKPKPSTNGYVTMGGEDEAAHYVEEWGFDWHTTAGAIN